MNSIFPGPRRFIYYLDQLQAILDMADGSENPALLIYQENIRTPFFMLEGLTRIYKEVYGKHVFKKLNNAFKEIEDSLGAIDYYDGFYREIIADKTRPDNISGYFEAQKESSLALLNDILENNNWIGKNQKRIREIYDKLDEIEWKPERDDTVAIKRAYNKYVTKICGEYKSGEIQFKSIEKDVHEFRRELRWLSIYPQALRGLIQLKADQNPPEALKKYLTTEIITSPYNKMPDGSNIHDPLMLNANNFYAGSWVIAELGKLKDNGLKVIAVTEALSKKLQIRKRQAEELAYSICGETQLRIPEILDRSESIVTAYFEERILENLVCI